ncbi:MAG: hypothetical protein ACOYNY_47365 [Caldilineaceae bacterium]|jgi:hypothetical protein
MFWRSRRVHRQWQLHYIYLYHGQEIREVARFFSQAEAEERFGTMQRYHTTRAQPIVQAQIRGPHGFQRDLLHA